jgi:hypothetical protein
VERGPKYGNRFFMCSYKKYFRNLLKNHWTRRAQIYKEASGPCPKLKLLKSWPLKIRRGHNTEKNYMYL